MSELSASRRRLVLVICCMSLFIVGIDVTIVNVALPSIQHEFSASVSGLQWTIDAYSLVLASLLMLSGSTADRLGRRRTFQVGLVLFTLGSLLCSAAPGLGWLISFRMLQAIGGSMLNPVAMSIIVNTFTDPRERARAIGVWGGAVGISLALGPVLGGILVQGIGWRSIFWINVPIGIAAIVLTQAFVPESKAPRARRIDPAGQLIIIVVLASLTYAIIEGPRRGWESAEIIGLFVVSGLAVGALIAAELRRPEPLIDVRFFHSVPFSAAAATAVCAFAGLGGFLFLNTLYLQDIRGWSALHAGLLTLPMAAMSGVFAPVSGRLVGTTGPRTPLLISGVALTVATALLAQVGLHSSIALLVVAYVVFGVGFGFVNAPITNTAVSGMPKEQAGVAAAIASTSRQIGSALGVAITGSLVSASQGRSAFVHDSHIAWWVITGCGSAVLVLGLVATSRWALATAERTRGRLETADDALGQAALVD